MTDLTRGVEGNSNAKVALPPDAVKAFEELKSGLRNCVKLAYPDPDASLELTTDASQLAAGAVLHQVKDGERMPLAFFSKKFSRTEINKSTYDRELLAIFLSLKNFNWLLGQSLVIRTDHKPLTFALTKKSPTPQQSRWLSYISEFDCKIVSIAGSDTIIADLMSRQVNAIAACFDPDFSTSQQSDQSLQHFFDHTTHPLVQRQINGTQLICDRYFRPFVPQNLRFSIFQQFHNLAHPGIFSTIEAIRDHFVWPHMNQDIKKWTKACMNCQKAKVWKHTKTPLANIPISERFHCVHIDIVCQLPPSNGYTHLVTMVDRFTRWTEVVPVRNISTESVATAFLTHWVSRFGVPRVIISDRGKQFESALWSLLLNKLGIVRKSTTAYHPQSNGAIERFHRTLKNAIRAKCQENKSWYSALPLILLGIRTAINRQGFSPAQMTYGTRIEVPTSFFVPDEPEVAEPTSHFLQKLFSEARKFPKPVRSHNKSTFVHKDLATAQYVWLREPSPRTTLSPRYSGPYKVISMTDKVVTLDIDNRTDNVSLDRVKPAYLELDHLEVTTVTAEQSLQQQIRQAKVICIWHKGHSRWPAVITDIDLTPLRGPLRKNQVAVRLFGRPAFAIVHEQNIFPFAFSNVKGLHLQKAFAIAKDFIQGVGEYSLKRTKVLHNKSVRFGPT